MVRYPHAVVYDTGDIARLPSLSSCRSGLKQLFNLGKVQIVHDATLPSWGPALHTTLRTISLCSGRC